MRDVLITSSVLIVLLLLLRLLFQKAISRRVQYALWALVLARLLIPVSLPASPASVLNFTPAATVSGFRPAAGGLPDASSSVSPSVSNIPAPILPVSDPDAGGTQIDTPALAPLATVVSPPGPAALLPLIWLVGSTLMALFFLWSNLRFYFKLRKTRTPYSTEGCSHRIYLCGALASPCLFGGAIYLTPAAVSSPERLRHVLAHEETHARHLDPVWALARGLCLTLYWFHPLVWVATAVSKVDCELACDEGALRRLGEVERLAYGRTLLSLIPVRGGPANPLLAATTMTAGKRRLRNRVARIAQRRKTVAAALVAVALLAAAIGACTFTGAETSREPEKRPLTAAELKYFNEEYFNGVVLSDYINPHNYFLSSLYEKPEDIDLYQLFYLELPKEFGGFNHPDDEECQLAFGQSPGEMPCAGYKLTPADMDAFLKEYTGLTLEETNKIGLDHFAYLPDYDAYYWAHGDTNYRRLPLLTGEREGGLIRLYYEGGGWESDTEKTGYACLTLKELEDGYHFVSNLPCEKPAIPTPLPEGAPALTIPLDGLAPYTAPALAVERHTDDYAEQFGGYSTGDQSVRRYRSTSGKVYAAVIYDETDLAWVVDCFLTLPDDEKASRLNGFSDLFGHNGVILSYTGTREGRGDAAINDYVYFADDGTPTLLARVYGEAKMRDLNGDGVDELVGDDQIFYQRDSTVYEADLPALLETAWPGMSFWESAQWNPYGKYLAVSGLCVPDGWPDKPDASFTRCLYFDGKNLLVYPGPQTANHMLEDVSAPDEVLAPIREYAKTAYETAIEPANRRLNNYTYDDWRISLVERVDLTDFNRTWPNAKLEVYRCAYQFRTPTPWDYHLRSSEVDEEGWLLDTFHTTRYLVFRVENGQRRLLTRDIAYPNISDEELQKALLQTLIQHHLLSPDDPTILPADYAQSVLSATAASGSVALTLSPGGGGPGARYMVAADAGNGRNRVVNFDAAFRWGFERADQPTSPPDYRSNLLVEAPDGSASIRCWEDFPVVLFTLNGEQRWLSAPVERDQGPFSNTIFDYLRLWYDEAEYSGLSEPWVVPDRGQSHQAVAQEMADLVHAAELKVSPGSMFACTYVRSVADVMEDLPDSYFPAAAEGKDRFGFSFAHIFVPENERSLYGHMPGNTGEYGGEYGPAPDHAFSEGLMGAIYLTDDGWRCDSIGTG